MPFPLAGLSGSPGLCLLGRTAFTEHVSAAVLPSPVAPRIVLKAQAGPRAGARTAAGRSWRLLPALPVRPRRAGPVLPLLPARPVAAQRKGALPEAPPSLPRRRLPLAGPRPALPAPLPRGQRRGRGRRAERAGRGRRANWRNTPGTAAARRPSTAPGGEQSGGALSRGRGEAAPAVGPGAPSPSRWSGGPLTFSRLCRAANSPSRTAAILAPSAEPSADLALPRRRHLGAVSWGGRGCGRGRCGRVGRALCSRRWKGLRVSNPGPAMEA